MTCEIIFEKIQEPDFPGGYYYAHIPLLDLTTHGMGIEGARNAAEDLIKLWIAEKETNGESVNILPELFHSTMEIENDAQVETVREKRCSAKK